MNEKTARPARKTGRRLRDWPTEDTDPNRAITAKLRALYNSIQEEGIPERFLDLLEKLDEAEKKSVPGPRGSNG